MASILCAFRRPVVLQRIGYRVHHAGDLGVLAGGCALRNPAACLLLVSQRGSTGLQYSIVERSGIVTVPVAGQSARDVRPAGLGADHGGASGRGSF